MKTIISAITAIICIFTGTGISINTNSENVTPDTASVSNESAVCESAIAETEYCTPDEKTTESSESVSEVTYSYEETAVTESPYVTHTEIPLTESQYATSKEETEDTSAEEDNSNIFTSAVDNDTYDEFSQYGTYEYDCPEYAEYQVLYKELLNTLRYETENVSVVEYLIFNMNNDDVPELVTVTGTCEADKTTTFYTIKDHQIVVIGENFRGDHCGFYCNRNNDRLVIRNDWGGFGSISEYEFDDNKIRESRCIKGYNYMENSEGYEKVVSEMFDLEYEVYGVADTYGNSCYYGLDFIMTELNNDSYYFTD